MALLLLSPAKTLNEASATRPELDAMITDPCFPEDTAALVTLLAALSTEQLKSVLKDVSTSLAELNRKRYAGFHTQPTKPCALAFDGPAYKGLDAPGLTAADLAWAQQHLRILSGLYGVLRPLDRIQPYRLDMGCKLANSAGKDLYALWGGRVVAALNQQLAALAREQPAGEGGDEQGSHAPFVVNVASQEYWKVVAGHQAELAAPVYTCAFPGPAVHAKQARGAMARFVITQRVVQPQQLQQFTGSRGEWRYDARQSTEFELVFVRGAPHGPKAAAPAAGAATSTQAAAGERAPKRALVVKAEDETAPEDGCSGQAEAEAPNRRARRAAQAPATQEQPGPAKRTRAGIAAAVPAASATTAAKPAAARQRARGAGSKA